MLHENPLLVFLTIIFMNWNIHMQYVLDKNKENTDKNSPKIYHPEITTIIHIFMYYNYR